MSNENDERQVINGNPLNGNDDQNALPNNRGERGLEQHDAKHERLTRELNEELARVRTLRVANAACAKAGIAIPHPEVSSDRTTIPTVLLTETNNWRMSHNFRALNKVTIVPSFPNADLAAKKSQLAGHNWYIGLDLASAYHAVPIRKSDWGLTAFQVPDKEYYCYTRIPFGLTNAGAARQEMILKSLTI